MSSSSAIATDVSSSTTSPSTCLPPIFPSSSHGPLTEFGLFSKLVIEIRMTIWRLTVQPRVVEIYKTKKGGIYSTANIPIAFQVCQESRESVLPYFSLCFKFGKHPAMTWVNFDTDTVFLSCTWRKPTKVMDSMSQDERNGIKYFAIGFDYCYDPANNPDNDLKEHVEAMEGLREVGIAWDVEFFDSEQYGFEILFPNPSDRQHRMRLSIDWPVDIDENEAKFSMPADTTEELKVTFAEMWKWNVPKVVKYIGWREGLAMRKLPEGAMIDNKRLVWKEQNAFNRKYGVTCLEVGEATDASDLCHFVKARVSCRCSFPGLTHV